MVQFHTEVSAMPRSSTITSASGRKPRPSVLVRNRKTISAMKAESMKTSPWAKFTMPMMPKTIV